MDSADVWANPHLFCLNENLQPTVVSGVPPDYFSETGQLWGHPLYRWDVMAQEGYAWWIERFRMAFTQADVVRIDHFGNIVTNLPPLTQSRYDVQVDRRTHAMGHFATYDEAPEGTPFLITGSNNTLEISLRNASANESFQMTPGQAIAIR